MESSWVAITSDLPVLQVFVIRGEVQSHLPLVHIRLASVTLLALAILAGSTGQLPLCDSFTHCDFPQKNVTVYCHCPAYDRYMTVKIALSILVKHLNFKRPAAGRYSLQIHYNPNRVHGTYLLEFC